MKQEVNVLRSVVEPLTMMLSGSDVKVTFRGSEAVTVFNMKTGKPEAIHLPMIPGDAPQELVSAFHGYLDHEVGHYLFTDLSKSGKKVNKSKMRATLFNIVEDPRIENLMCSRFRGSQYNLNNAHQIVFPEALAASLFGKEGWEDEQQIMLSAVLMSVRALSGQEYFQKLINSSDSLKTFAEKIHAEFGDRFKSLKSTDDAVAISEELAKFLDIDLDKKGEEKKSESQESESSGDGNDGEKDDSDGGEGKENKKEGSDKEEKSGSDDKKESGEKDASEEVVRNLLKSDGDIFEKLASAELERRATKVQEDLPYTVYTTDFDKVEHANIQNMDGIAELDEATSSMVGPIQKSFERAIAARSLVIWTGGHRKGKLHGASLSKLFTGDEKVFRQKQEAKSKDVAVTLLVDCSGSMFGTRIDIAIKSAYAMGMVLNRMGVNNEIIGFTTLDDDIVSSSYKESHKPKPHKRYSRYEPLYMPVFKSFTDRWDSQAKARLSSAIQMNRTFRSGFWMRNNVDGECVQIAANRLLQRPEKKKVMIVLSDGYPNAQGDEDAQFGHLKRTVKTLENKIEIVAIGIQSKFVRDFYKNWVEITKLEELPSEVIKKVQSFLLA